MRRGFQVLVIGYVGFLAGAPLAQSLFAGWAQNGVPWRSAPALALLGAAALLVPWAARKPLYCQHLCPHGAAQELLGFSGERHVGQDELYLVYGDPNQLNTLPAFIVKFVHYFGAQKGT